jgi:hypothetical protein
MDEMRSLFHPLGLELWMLGERETAESQSAWLSYVICFVCLNMAYLTNKKY